jgi:septal ring factor EnvC (AmiA/AmiB activator)
MDPSLIIPLLTGVAALIGGGAALRNSRTSSTAQNLTEIRALAEETRTTLAETRAALRETQATLREAQLEADEQRRERRQCEDCLSALRRELGHSRRVTEGGGE